MAGNTLMASIIYVRGLQVRQIVAILEGVHTIIERLSYLILKSNFSFSDFNS